MSERPPSQKPTRVLQPQSERLANLLTLEKHFRQAETVESISFLLVNELRIVARYRNAILWRHGKVSAVSDIPAPTRDAPFTLWMRDVCRHLQTRRETTPVTANDLPPELARSWHEFLPAYGLWLPLEHPATAHSSHTSDTSPAAPDALAATTEPADAANDAGTVDDSVEKNASASKNAESHSNTPPTELDGLFFARENPWLPAECELLKHAAGAAHHAMLALEATSPRLWPLIRSKLPFGRLTARQRRHYGLLLLVLLLFPVRLSVVAPAEVSARDMYVVRAPVTGVIKEIVASPNSPVEAGDVLLSLDEQEWQSKRQVALQALAVARSELANAQQAAITNAEAQATLNILARRVEQRMAELEQIEAVIERLDIHTDRAGIALIADRDALRGKPVQIGEKIMAVANADNAQIEAWIPVADSITLPPQAPVKFYLNIAPHRAIRAHIYNVSYQATLSPAGVLAFRATAQINAKELPRLGLHGTAKIYGRHVPLSYYLLRKPLTVLGKWLGW